MTETVLTADGKPAARTTVLKVDGKPTCKTNRLMVDGKPTNEQTTRAPLNGKLRDAQNRLMAGSTGNRAHPHGHLECGLEESRPTPFLGPYDRYIWRCEPGIGGSKQM